MTTTSDAIDAAADAGEEMATPTLAAESAAASFSPSPIINTGELDVFRFSRLFPLPNVLICLSFSSGLSPAYT